MRTQKNLSKTSGFTIVELLIVIVVIAILAAISVVAYRGMQNRAYDTAVQNDLGSLRKKLGLSAVDHERFSYVDITGFKVSKSSYAVSPTTTYNLVFCFPSITDYSQYAVAALSKSGKIFYISNLDTVKEYVGSWGASGQAICDALSPDYDNNFRGYAAEDTTTGPWRSWVGGN